MLKDKFHIDHYLKQGLKDLEVAPPPDVWKNIEEHLDKKRRSGWLSVWSALAAGLVLFIGIGTLLHYQKSHYPEFFQHHKVVMAAPQAIDVRSPSKSQETSGKPGLHSAPTNTLQSSEDLHNQGTADSAGGVGKALPGDDRQTKDWYVESTQEQAEYNSNSRTAIARTDYSTSNAGDHQPGRPSFGPLGANLQEKTRSHIIIPPAYAMADKPSTETNPVLSEDVEIRESPKKQRWSLAGQVAPVYSYRTANQGQSSEKGLVAYSGGIKVNYKVSSRLSFQAGVYYAVMGQMVDNVPVVNFSSNTQYNGSYSNAGKNLLISTYNSMGPITGENSSGSNYMVSNVPYNKQYDQLGNTVGSPANTAQQQGTVVQKLNFVEVPFLARYKIIDRTDKQFGLHLIGGLSTNILVNNYVILKVDGNSNRFGSTANLNPVNYSGTLGFGIDYGFLRKIDISVEPTYKYYLNSISSNKDINFHPYSFGLFTGIIYKF